MARKRLIGRTVVPDLKPSSTSEMLKGLVFKDKTISKVLKREGAEDRYVYYTDGTSEHLSKEDIKSLARIKGAMQGAEQSKNLTPWERRQRISRGMKIKESWLARDKKDFIEKRNRAGELAKFVEGAPRVKMVRRRGVNIPVIAQYYSTRQPDIKSLIDRVKTDLGRTWAWKLKFKLRSMNPSKAMEELLAEYKEKK